ncbi:LLM class flavin-dependent oxidoreductase [Catenulispora yoronensis]|uniref:LLM class flavin-dependent oxidoreductase n=1 Tax=Catenulispora yoronensis TaxID=450799 RepID=A0ABN2TQ64_9ACTN
MTNTRLGIMYDRAWDPAGLPDFARRVEAVGADDLWVVEDLGWNGGLTAAAVALGATERLRVGLGIAPAPYRNPALFAMEVATLARVFPGRFAPGLGHGVSGWLEQVGATPGSSMARLEETLTAVGALLRGETVTMTGREVTLKDVTLVHPPTVVPPLFAAAVRAKTLELSGRRAQGTVIAEGHGPKDLENARAHIARGGADHDHDLAVFAFCHVGDDEPGRTALTAALADQADWLSREPQDLFTVSGTPEQGADRVRELFASGATTVVLRIYGAEPAEQLGAVVEALGG